MKRMLLRIGTPTLSRCGLMLGGFLFAAAMVMGMPRAGQAQTSGESEATEQLFDAVHAKDFAAVQASVAAGADVEASDRWGMTPMELAIDKGYFEIGHYLVAVRNFNRSNADKRPAPPVAAGSPFGSSRAGDMAVRNAGRMSPLGPLSTPAGKSGAVDGDVNMETSAGRADNPARASVKDNPFDPNAPAHGSDVFSVGEIGGAATEALAPFATSSGPLNGENTAADASAAIGGTPRSASDDRGGAARESGFSNRVIGVGGESQ